MNQLVCQKILLILKTYQALSFWKEGEEIGGIIYKNEKMSQIPEAEKNAGPIILNLLFIKQESPQKDHKRHTARHVASACSAVLSGEGLFQSCHGQGVSLSWGSPGFVWKIPLAGW